MSLDTHSLFIIVYMLEDPGSIPVIGNVFVLTPPQQRLYAHPASYAMASGFYFFGAEVAEASS
jgi:hypothetical protein